MKKVLALLLALALIFTLSACGKKDTSSDTDTSAPTSTTETTSEPADNSSEEDSDKETDGGTSDTGTPAESSKPTNNSKPTDTSKPDNSKPTETSKPTTTTTPSTPSKPSEPEETKPISLSFMGQIPAKDLNLSDGVDKVYINLFLKESANGDFTVSYDYAGFIGLDIDNLTQTQKDTLKNSVDRFEDFWFDSAGYSGFYWGWVSIGFGSGYNYNSFDEFKAELSEFKNEDGLVYFPSAMFGKNYVCHQDTISCNYDKATGKLTFGNNFIFKEITIKEKNKFTANGKEYSAKPFCDEGLY